MSRIEADASALGQAPTGDPGEAPAEDQNLDGRAKRWENHRITRRDELTRAARKAVHHGGADLSMDEIAAAIGTSKSIVYRYFRDRSGLQTAVGEAVLRDLGAALAEASRHATTPEAMLRAMVNVYLEMISTSPAVYAFVTQGADVADADSPMRTLADDTAALLVPVLADLLRAQGRPASLARVWAAGIIGFVRGAAEVWLTDPSVAGPGGPEAKADDGAAPLTALAEAITDWVGHGISGAPPGT